MSASAQPTTNAPEGFRSREERQSQLSEELVVLRRSRLDFLIQRDQLPMHRREVDLLLRGRRADVAGDVEVVALLDDSLHRDALGIAVLFFSELVGVDDLGDVVFREAVLAFAFLEVLRAAGVDEEHVVRLLALLEHEDADGDAGGIKQIGGQADDGVDVAVFEQFGADAFLRAATEEHAVGQDDGHHAFVFQEVKTVQQEGEIGGGFGGEAVVFETHVVAHRVGGVPAVAEGRVGDDGVEVGLLGGVEFAQDVPVVGQGVAVINLELRILHPMQQHVHAGEVVGGDVLFLSESLADAIRPHALSHVQEQGAGATGEIEDLLQSRLLSSGGLLTVESDDGREDVGNLLRGVELARLLAGAGGELADQVFVGVPQSIGVGGEIGQALGDLLDDGAELAVSVFVFLAQLWGGQINLGEQPLEGALKGVVLDVFETRLQGVEQVPVLPPGHLGDAGPEVVRLDDIMHLAPHLLLKRGDIVGVVRIPVGQRHAAAIVF